jgi:hypothetical protein
MNRVSASGCNKARWSLRCRFCIVLTVGRAKAGPSSWQQYIALFPFFLERGEGIILIKQAFPGFCNLLLPGGRTRFSASGKSSDRKPAPQPRRNKSRSPFLSQWSSACPPFLHHHPPFPYHRGLSFTKWYCTLEAATPASSLCARHSHPNLELHHKLRKKAGIPGHQIPFWDRCQKGKERSRRFFKIQRNLQEIVKKWKVRRVNNQRREMSSLSGKNNTEIRRSNLSFDSQISFPKGHSSPPVHYN